MMDEYALTAQTDIPPATVAAAAAAASNGYLLNHLVHHQPAGQRSIVSTSFQALY